MSALIKMKMVANITVFPPKMKPAELHLMIGCILGSAAVGSGTWAITAGRAYALTTITLVRKAHSPTHRPL
jgi:hypothetical protein